MSKLDSKEQREERDLTKFNIENIEKDAERLKILNQGQNQSSEEQPHFIEDVDDLSNYSHNEGGVKVLDDTTSINRKAIFHDLDRLKHWRESMDQDTGSDGETNEKLDKPEKTQFAPIMEKNVDHILKQLPDVQGEGDVDQTIDSKAAEKLEEIETRLKRGYTLD